MRLNRAALVLSILLVGGAADGAGLVQSDNFIVLTPPDASADAERKFAQLVLDRAEEFRAQVSKEWLGRELPTGEGRTAVYVHLSTTKNDGLTWAKDGPNVRLHEIYLTTSPENAAGSTLHHEIAHAVLATQFPHPQRLPTWLEEGIASRYDDEASTAARQRIVRDWAHSGRAPRLASILEMTRFPSADDGAYAAGTSLVNFLLTRGDRETLLRFGATGAASGWAAALRTHYQIADVGQLQAAWEAWLQTSGETTASARPQPAPRG